MNGRICSSRCRSYSWRRGWGRPEREPKDGSADRRLVICKKFISTFKKREPKRSGCPRTWVEGAELGARMRRQALSAPSCSTRDGEGTGHRLTDSRTRSRAHGSRINNFIYTLHTVCTAPLLARGSGRIKEMGGKLCTALPPTEVQEGWTQAWDTGVPYLLLRGQGAPGETRRNPRVGERWAGAHMYIRRV